MQIEQWLLNLGSVAVGGTFALAANWFATAWQARREERAAVRQRSRDAAEKVLDLVDEASAMFDERYQHGSAPSQADLRDVVRGIERHSLLLLNSTARTNLEWVSVALLHADALDEIGHGPPSRIGYQVRREAHSTLGAVMRDENVVPSSKLQEFATDIDDYYAHRES